MKTKSSVLCFAMVLTALVAMNVAAQDAGKAARIPGLYADDAFIGDASLSEATEYLTNNARDGVHYTIVLGNDDKAHAIKLDYGGKQVRVTLATSGGKHRVTFDRANPTGTLFSVGAGVTFTLEEGVTLSGAGVGENNRLSLIDISGGEFIMNGGEISGNRASYGGGVYVRDGGTFTMSGGEISGNSGYGGVYVRNGGTFTLSDGTISGNSASYGGGGVYVRDGGTFTMSGGEISGNSGYGGVYVRDGGTFTMSGGEISGNSTNSDGGGVYVYNGGTFTMNDGKISGNSALGDDIAGGWGGGVFVGNGGTFTMNGGKISGNSSGGWGGGVSVSNGTFTMSGGEISGNIASSGGGVYVRSYVSGKGTFTKSGTAGIIYGSNGPKGKANLAKSNESGHAVCVEGDPPKVRNSTADETTALDTAKSRLEGGGWERPADTPEVSIMRVTMDTSRLKYLAKESRYETLGLREQPSTTARVLARLSRRDRVVILQEGAAVTIDGMRSNWVQVEALSGEHAGQKGWVFKGYLDE